MNKKLLIPKNIITVNENDEILRNSVIELIDGDINDIAEIKKFDLNNYNGEIFRYPSYTIVPGFIQTHVHLCQTLFRGLADDLELLDWLRKKIFPFENAHNQESLRASAILGITELLTGGTTTILDMGTINHQEIIFDELIKSGMRAFSGKCMIDGNDIFSSFKEKREDSISSSYRLAKEFHNTNNGKIKYAFAPRFVLSCSEKLLKDTMEMVMEFDRSLYHSHASENKNEIKEVIKKYGKENIEYFNSIGVLSDRTVLAHCIHLNDKEIGILKETQTRVAHCPSANLKLGSGIANIPRYMNEGISVSLGADGPPCNNNLSIFNEMRLASLIQKPIHSSTVMSARDVLRLATIDGARALHLEDVVGSIEVGKKADLVILDLDTVSHSLLDEDDQLYSNIVYSSTTECVKEVMINGEWVVKDRKSLVYDEEESYIIGKNELIKLLKRIN